jgi:hypothetical protein
MKPDETCYTCTKSTCTNGNGNDYEDLLRMMRKFSIPIVTIHKGNSKGIICFAANGTTEYIFEGNELLDIVPMEITFKEWILCRFIPPKGDGSTITIYNH